MSASNRNGRALEFAYLIVLEKMIKPIRNVVIIQNSSFEVCKFAWNEIDKNIQDIFIISTMAGINAILESEPLILDTTDSLDILELKIQQDTEGKTGDVRDILIIRGNISWEIGISIKNNHFAVKHSRLSNKLDFGEKWFGIKCSCNYWNDIEPIFSYLTECKFKGLKWNEISSKENDVYKPLLSAFLNEIKNSYNIHGELIAKNMVEYIIGKYDFYKTVSVTNKKLTTVQPYNLRGMLNKPTKKQKPKLIVPIAKLPTRIINADFKPNSNNTVEIFMDEGWQFSFRIHNASTKVENSLKFDIKIIGMPTSIISIDYRWDD
ncbi:MAG: HaeIII family restriction endonuclease [Defluviitaleaceae bacterium]|nr:HaeIII family restriction endonuclease [Defluviitaleaceae bacterium]